MLIENKISVCVMAYRKLTDITRYGRVISGKLPSDDYFEFKKLLENHAILGENDDTKHEVQINLPIETNQFFAFDFQDLISSPYRQTKIPDNFYIADIDYFYTGISRDDDPLKVGQYFDTVKLARALIEVADYEIDGPPPQLIFLHGKKFELLLEYYEEDLAKISMLDVFINDFIFADIHSSQKNTIIKTVLLEMLEKSSIKDFTLAYITHHFDEFYDRVKANYQLYVSEFSFEKIKSQVEKEKFDFTIKFNKVFSEIQNQLLAIPVALMIAGSQMENSGEVTIKNVFIITGVLIFSLFIFLLTNNQKNTLKALKSEIDFQWSLIKNRHAAAEDRLKIYYDGLANRHNEQTNTLNIVLAVVSSLMVLSVCLFLYYSGILASDFFS